jgi:hypothetical protein
MIVSKQFLAAVSAKLDLHLIKATHLRTIAGWCLEYFGTYGRAPGKSIENIFYSWLEKHEESPPEATAVREVLSTLSARYDEGEEFNVPYLIDEFGKHLLARRLESLKDSLEDTLSQGSTKAALADVQDFKVPLLGRGVGFDPLNDNAAWSAAFEGLSESLITFPGGAGRFLNESMVREGLIAIQGPEKRGKTFWCLEFVVRALRHRRKVAFFSVGDLSDGQVLLRLGSRLEGAPIWKSQLGRIMVPVKITRPASHDEIPKVSYQPKKAKKIVTREGCEAAIRKFTRTCGIPEGKPYLMVASYPTWSINVKEIETVLDGWEMEQGFVPDVIVIDYADILAPEDSRKQGRDQVNETWAALRRLSQRRRSLVVAPTQANADSYGQRLQSMMNFSEDKRKLAHVTGMLGLNQTMEEKSWGLMRLNWIVLRESPHSVRRCLHVGQCLALGRAMCCSMLEQGGPDVSDRQEV